MHSGASVLREDFEELIEGLPPICFRVVVGAMWLLTLLDLPTGVHLVVEWMVLLLLPAVGKLASVLMLAPIRIRLDKVLSLPLRTLILLIVKNVWFSPEILPVVGVDASIAGVISI